MGHYHIKTAPSPAAYHISYSYASHDLQNASPRFVQFAENRSSCKCGLHACIFHRPLIYFNNRVKFRIPLDQKVSSGGRSLKDRFSGLAASRKGGHKFLYSFAPACVDYQNKTINSGCGAAIYRKRCLRFRCMSTVHDRTLLVITGLPRGLYYT